MSLALKNLRVVWKLLLVGFGFIVCTGGAAFMAQRTFQIVQVGGPLYQTISDNKDLLADVLPPPEYAIEAYLVANQIATAKDEAAQVKLLARASTLRKDFEDRHAFWEKTLPPGKNKEILTGAAYEHGKKLFDEIEGPLARAVHDGDRARAAAVVQGPMAEIYEQHREAIDQVVALSTEASKETETRVAAVIASSQRQLAAVGIATILIVLVLLRVVGMQIVRPLEASMKALRRFAEGDLTARVEVDRQDEMGALMTSFNQAASSTEGLVMRLGDVVSNVAGAASQLAAASEDIARGAQEQAASLEETAASLHEISATVTGSTDGANQACGIAEQARSAADRGKEVVGEAVGSMGEITAAAKNIGEISSTIDEIAFQTNLLALNAAVEAARAGDLGRGFAVVAAEVRALALRSATASKQIRTLIVDSITKIEQGAVHIRESGDRLAEIVDASTRVTDAVQGIAASAAEQSSGLGEVSRAVTQLDSVTQSNAAQTEELSSTAEALQQQAAELRALVSKFHVSGRAIEAAPPPAERSSARRGGRLVSSRSGSAGDARRQPARAAPAKSAARGDHDAMFE